MHHAISFQRLHLEVLGCHIWVEKHHVLASHLALIVELAMPKECYSVKSHLLAGTGQMNATPSESDVPVLYNDIIEKVSVRCLATKSPLTSLRYHGATFEL